MGTLKNFREKISKPKKGGSLKVPKKRKRSASKNLFKKLAHTHGFEHEPSGLKSKHLITGPRTPELPITLAYRNITLAYRKCKKMQTNLVSLYIPKFESTHAGTPLQTTGGTSVTTCEGNVGQGYRKNYFNKNNCNKSIII